MMSWRNDVCAMRKRMCRCAAMRGRTIGNALRVALRIFSGKNILNRAMPGGLRTARHCVFTGGTWTANGRAAPASCGSGGAGGRTLSGSHSFASGSRQRGSAAGQPESTIFTKNRTMHRAKRLILPELPSAPGFALHPIPACGILSSVMEKLRCGVPGHSKKEEETNDEDWI